MSYYSRLKSLPDKEGRKCLFIIKCSEKSFEISASDKKKKQEWIQGVFPHCSDTASSVRILSSFLTLPVRPDGLVCNPSNCQWFPSTCVSRQLYKRASSCWGWGCPLCTARPGWSAGNSGRGSSWRRRTWRRVWRSSRWPMRKNRDSWSLWGRYNSEVKAENVNTPVQKDLRYQLVHSPVSQSTDGTSNTCIVKHVTLSYYWYKYVGVVIL